MNAEAVPSIMADVVASFGDLVNDFVVALADLVNDVVVTSAASTRDDFALAPPPADDAPSP